MDGGEVVPGIYSPIDTMNSTSAYFHLWVDSRHCLATGSVEIHDIAYGHNAYVERLHLSFEQVCGWSGGSARGEVLFEAAPPPPTLAVTPSIGSVTQSRSTDTTQATVTVSCNKEAQVELFVNLRQRTSSNAVVEATGSAFVACGPQPTTHIVAVTTVDPARPLRPGKATLTAVTAALDSDWSEYTTSEVIEEIRIRPN